MRFLPKSKFVFHKPDEWTADDDSDMRELVQIRYFQAFKKSLHKRLENRIEQLIGGEDTRSRIDEIRDILTELDNYDS